jgi:hypothetical protein
MSKNKSPRIPRLMLLAGACLLLLTGTPALASSTWNVGDIFLGVASGQYQVRDQSGVLKETLDTGRGGFTTGCAFSSNDNLYVTEFNANQVSIFEGPNDPHNNFLFGAALYNNPEMLAFDKSGRVYVGNRTGGGIHQFASNGAFIKTIVPGVRVDFFDIAADQDTILFGQEGDSVLTASISTGLQGPDFTTGTATQAFAMRILPDGGLLLADRNNIKRYNSAGVVIGGYNVTGESFWFSLNLDPDGTSFWSGNPATANYYKFDADTGGNNSHIAGPFNTGTGINTFFGMCIFGEPTVAIDPIEVAKAYRHTNTCFERDNDADGMISEDGPDGEDGLGFIDNDDDGLVDEDPSECPDGTNPGDIIDNDGDGTYFVESVFKKNDSVASYNPGQLYAVATINVLRDINRLILGEFYDDCTLGPDDLLDLNPKKGGGRAKVVVEHPDGTLEQVFDANTDDPQVVFLSDEEDTIAVLLHSFAAGDIVHLYVKFGPGDDSTGDGSCVNAAAGVVPNGPAPFVVTDFATLVVTPKVD